MPCPIVFTLLLLHLLLSFLPPRLVIRSSRAELRRAVSTFLSFLCRRAVSSRVPWAPGVRKVTDTVKGHFAARSRLRKAAQIASLAVKMAFRAVIRPTDSRCHLTLCAGHVLVVVVLVADVLESPRTDFRVCQSARFSHVSSPLGESAFSKVPRAIPFVSTSAPVPRGFSVHATIQLRSRAHIRLLAASSSLASRLRLGGK